MTLEKMRNFVNDYRRKNSDDSEDGSGKRLQKFYKS